MNSIAVDRTISGHEILYLDSIGTLYYFMSYFSSTTQEYYYFSLRQFNSMDIDSAAIMILDSTLHIRRKRVAPLHPVVKKTDNRFYLLNGRVTHSTFQAAVFDRKVRIRLPGY